MNGSPLSAVRVILGLGVLGLAACGETELSPSASVESGSDVGGGPIFVGSDGCVQCHADETRWWEGSHHDLAMQEANERTVLGDFDNAVFTYNGVSSRFYRRDGKYLVWTDGPDGELTEYEIAYTFGVEPLQQYLIGFPRGRFQALSICWDTRLAQEGGQRWFHLYPDEEVDHDDPLHWTGIHQNWNYMCAECHSTNLRKGFLPEEDRYETIWSEIDVACEACHGPGSRHLAWANDLLEGTKRRYEEPHKGLVVRLEDPGRGTWTINPDTGNGFRLGPPVTTQEIETCARCHSRRGVVHEEYVFGRPLLDTHRLALLEEGLYHADGQILEEVYVHGSFLQSKMYQAGVTCSDCHDPHSLDLHFPGDGVCFRCHSQEKFAVQDHHFHKPGTRGSSCVDCHMPPKDYMVVDPRHDHSMRVPRPDLAEKLGASDACTGCHTDKPDDWAARAVSRWYERNRRAEPHYGEALHAGRAGLPGAERELIELVRTDEMPAIARATALTLLARHFSPGSLDTVEWALGDAEPLIRWGALRALEAADPRARFRLAYPLLTDPVRMIRIEAARVLAAHPPGRLSAEQGGVLEAALEEFREAHRLNADRPEAHLSLGWLHAVQGEVEEAESSYRRALEIDPSFIPAYVNLADLHRQQGRDREGEQVLREALAVAPDAGEVHHALGLVLVRQQRREEALEQLALAAELLPEEPRYTYVYGVALHDLGQSEKAFAVLEEAHERHPIDQQLLWGLATLHRARGDTNAAIDYARKLLELTPQDPQVLQFLEQLE